MESKFVIFLVFASLAHGAYIPSLSENFGLSDKDAATLNEIIVNEALTVNAYAGGIEHFFESLLDQGVDADTDYATVNQALEKVKEAARTYFKSDLLVLGESCFAVETALQKAYSSADDTYARIYSAVRSARTQSYSESRPIIESHNAAAKENYKVAVDSEYDAILYCLNTTDADLLAEIEHARQGSHTSLVHLNNAIFNGIKVLAAADRTRCGDLTLTNDLEEHRIQSLNRINNNVEYKLSLVRTVYINSHISANGIVPSLAVNQHGLTVSSNKYHVAYASMYDIVFYFLRRIDLGINEEGDDDYTRHDAIVAEVNVRFGTVGNLTLDAIPLINPAFAAILAALREILTEMSIEGDNAFLDVVDAVIAHDNKNYDELQEIMDHFRAIAIDVYEPSNVMIFQFIRNDLTWSDETDAKLIALQAQANESSKGASHKFFDAVEIMVRCMVEGKVSQADYDAIYDLRDQSYSEVDTLLQSLFAAGFYVLQEHHSSN